MHWETSRLSSGSAACAVICGKGGDPSAWETLGKELRTIDDLLPFANNALSVRLFHKSGIASCKSVPLSSYHPRLIFLLPRYYTFQNLLLERQRTGSYIHPKPPYCLPRNGRLGLRHVYHKQLASHKHRRKQQPIQLGSERRRRRMNYVVYITSGRRFENV